MEIKGLPKTPRWNTRVYQRLQDERQGSTKGFKMEYEGLPKTSR